MNVRRLFLTTSVVGSTPAAARERFAAPESAAMAPDPGSFDELDAYIQRQMNRLRVPGASVAVVEGDRIVHARGFGRARPNGETPTPQTPFFIASLTKSITALAVMQLVEAGKIEPDAPVQRYLPWFRVADPDASARMTVRHLLNQTSGLPTWAGELPLADFDDSPDTAERQACALSSLVLARPAGSAFEYSNSNYNLLGLVMEAATGEPYLDYVRDHIFSPLEMDRTHASPAAAKQDGLAVGHRYWFTIPFAAPDMTVPRGALAGGGLVSCAEDIAHYLIPHLNGGRYRDVQLLSSAGFDEMHRGVGEVSAMGRVLGRYAMGWYADKIGKAQILWHSGILPHFFSYMALLPEQKRGIVLLLNADHHVMSPVLTEALGGAVALLAGERPVPIPALRLFPWLLRGLPLIPALQTAEVVATRRRLRRWQTDPESRPADGRRWGVNVLLPLIANLPVILMLRSMLGRRRDYLRLYLPDYSWTALVCGSFALAWSFLRTWLVLRAFRRFRSLSAGAEAITDGMGRAAGS